MSLLNPRTAHPSNSIWLSIPEANFRQHLVQLESRTDTIPIDPQVFPIKDWQPPASSLDPHRPHTLPLVTEQRLADDFAFIAAIVEGAQSVAAVCIEENAQPPGITLRFAALDVSHNHEMKLALQALFQIISLAVTPGLTDKDADTYINDLFCQVIGLHSNRLLARLRSSKWTKPKYLSRDTKKPLWQDFPNLIHRIQFIYTKKEKPTRQLVEKQISDLSKIYSDFESSPDSGLLSSLMELVKATSNFCAKAEIKDFILRIQSQPTKKPTPQLASAIKSLRQLKKIASYHHICTSLITTARTYPNLFRSIDVEYLIPYESIPTDISYYSWGKTCHVHAEIQLAVHYDLASQSSSFTKPQYLKPRCIGTSKWLCYLCYRFLEAHNTFFPSKTHGRLYDQWTVPDLGEFNNNSVSQYRGIVNSMDEIIQQQIAHEPEMGRLAPMTSCDSGREDHG